MEEVPQMQCYNKSKIISSIFQFKNFTNAYVDKSMIYHLLTSNLSIQNQLQILEILLKFRGLQTQICEHLITSSIKATKMT